MFHISVKLTNSPSRVSFNMGRIILLQDNLTEYTKLNIWKENKNLTNIIFRI